MQLSVKGSTTLQQGEVLVINALGLLSHKSPRTQFGGTQVGISDTGNENSERDLRDGFTFFGCKKSMFFNSNKKKAVNDFIIPSKNEVAAEQHRGRHFQIQFDLENNSYFMRDLGVGYGVFYRMQQPEMLKDNMLMNVGDAYIVVNIVTSPICRDPDFQENCLKGQPQENLHICDSLYDEAFENSNAALDFAENDDLHRLKLKIFGGPCAGDVYFFKNDGQEIVIGRTA